MNVRADTDAGMGTGVSEGVGVDVDKRAGKRALTVEP